MAMKKLRSIIVVLLLLSGSVRMLAQDFHLSMYDAGPLFLNPALTGLVDADWRIHAQYRNQWKAVAFKPYNTGLISFDAPVGKWGFGGQITEMRAGIGNYNVLQGLASAAYTISIDKKQFHNLSLGVQAGATQKSIEYKLYTFDNQYTAANGGSFNQDLPSGENFGTQSRILPQVNAGALYYYSRMQSRFNPFVGFSAFNLTQPKETFFGTNNLLPIRYYLHAGIRINVTEQLYFIPKVLVMRQANANEQTAALDVGYFLSEQKIYLLGGVVYRNLDAAAFSLGARLDNIIGKVSYDVNVSSLARASNGRGAFEISVTYMSKKKRKAKLTSACPRI
ncbi:MAG: putative rane protein [Bacteroidetes bacterium]|jgi:type IX secretion system PorP/SprF family membrane protein|nr:putative rane protein [Bacteroidota bacterium]